MMRRLLVFLLALLPATLARATTYNFSPSNSESSIWNTSFNSGDTVNFAAGTYNWSSPHNLTCGVTYTGPAQSNFFANSFNPGQDLKAMTPSQPTAIINFSNTGASIMNLSGCSTGSATTTVEWLWFENSGAFYDDGSGNNVAFLHNWCTGIAPNTLNTGNQTSCFFIDGSGATQNSSNFLIEYNQFGDSSSCGEIFSLTYGNAPGGNPDWGGLCTGVFTNTGVLTNFVVQYNFFYHMEEHVKLVQRGSYPSGPVSTCDECSIRYNLMYQFKRIMIEDQASVDSGATGIYVSDNAAGWGLLTLGSSFGWSMACCQSNGNQTANGADPADYINDNLIVNVYTTSNPENGGGPLQNGVEWWGVGATFNNNYLIGSMGSYLLVGYGSGPSGYGSPQWTVNNNYMCADNNPYGYGFYNNEENSVSSQSNAPTNLTYNGQNNPFSGSAAAGTTSTTCSAQNSTPSTISPSSGTYSFPLTVTLSNSGLNTSSYYTTDGTNPVPGQGSTQLYTGPFTLTSAGTVKVVGMWGVPPQPTSYTAPYGFVPSSAATATYSSSGGGGTPTAATPSYTPGAESFSGSVSVSASSSTSGATLHCTTNGTTPTSSSAAYTGPFTFTATTTLECIAVASGYNNSAVASATYTLSSNPGITLTSVNLTSASGSNSITTGATVQMTATCGYSNATSDICNSPDAHGNSVSAWASSKSSSVSISSTGLVTGVAAGSANLTATVGSVTSPIFTMTDSPAANYTIAAGASESTIQNTINSAAAASGGNTVLFSSGSYSISSPISIPCPASPLTITGPSTGYPENYSARPTAVLNNTNSGDAPQIISIDGGCSTQLTIQYLECNGNQPTSGGGCIDVNEGGQNDPTSNLTIQDNYFHGNQEIVPVVAGNAPNQYWDYDDTNANLIRFEGTPGGNTDSNIVITGNIFGNPTPGDCSNVMTFTGGNIEASGDNSNPTQLVFVGYDQPGGNCDGIGIDSSIENFTVTNNVFQQLEQGMKFFEGGGSAPNLFYQTNVNILNNDFSFIHRIGIENQGSPTTSVVSGSAFNINYNDFHDWIGSSFGSWTLSMAACCLQPSPAPINAIGNVFISNTGQSGNVGPGTIEWWTGPNGQYANNFVQGNWNPGAQYGYYNPPISMVNNIFQLSAQGASIINNEEGETQTPVYLTPNTSNIGVSMTPLTSASPSISPAGGTFSGSQVVTITNNGDGSGTGPQGNTGSWCTTDGSNPVPKSGTAQYYPTGSTLTISSNTTLTCRGMWGGVTQPGSYPSGYGYVPSAAVTETFSCTTCGGGGGTGPGEPTVVAPTISPGGTLTFTTAFQATVTAGTAGASIYCATNGVTPTTSSPLYTGPINVTATMTLSCMSALAGYNNSTVVTANYTYALSLGTPNVNVNGATQQGLANALYVVTGPSSMGYTVESAMLNLTTGIVTSGAKTDVILAAATSATGENATPLCYGTWTNSSSAGPGWVNIPMSGCPTLAATTAYWLITVTNDPLSPSPLGMWNCSTNCTSTVPTSNSGFYTGFTASLNYGAPYTLPTTLTAGSNEPSMYLNLALASSPVAATPVISPNTSTFPPGTSQTISITDSTPGAAIHYTTDGSTPTSSSPVYSGTFSVSSTTTVNAVAYATGYAPSSVATATYTQATASFSFAYLATATNLNFAGVGFPVNFTAVVGYTDGANYTLSCTGAPCADPRGTYISLWTSGTHATGTINAAGLFTPVAVGSTNIQAAITYSGGSATANWTEYVPKSVNIDLYDVNLYGIAIQ